MTQDYISASEINEFLYCHRAWWYRLRGFISANQDVMDAGAEEHESLAQAVQAVTRFQRLGRRLLLAGAALLIVFIVLRSLSGVP